MESALRARALAHAPLAALVGDRADWELRPQLEGLPAVTFQVIGGAIEQNYDGDQALQSARVQADVWARDYGEKKAVMAALLAALVPPAEQDGIRFSRASVDREGDLDSGAEGIFRRSADLIVWWQQA